MSRNSRVVSPICLMFIHLHPSWRNYTRRHSIFSQVQWMPDVVPTSNINPACHRIFQLQKRLSSKMNWLRKPHGAHSIPTMCALPMNRRGFNINTPETFSQDGEDNILLPQQRSTRENLINPAMSPPRHEMPVAAQEFHKLHEPKIN